MDTLTHAAVGAIIGEKFSSDKKGFKAPIAGAFLANFPDLDVIFGVFLNDLQLLTFHRGFSHSIFFLFIMSFPVAWLLNRYFSVFKGRPYKHALGFIAVCFGTHLLLDLFTSYGMILFWPFTMNPVSLNIISIVDPMFTLPLLAGLAVYFLGQRKMKYLNTAIILSSAYLIFTVGHKVYITNHYEKRLNAESVNYIRFETKPTLMNNLLWRGLAETEETYMVSFYSHFDEKTQPWMTFTKQHDLLDPIRHLPEIKTLTRALENTYIVEKPDDQIWYVHDMRFGKAVEWLPDRESNFVFSYKITVDDQDRVKVERDRLAISADTDRPDFGELIDRIKGKW